MLSELFGFIWLMGRHHQALVAGLSLALSLSARRLSNSSAGSSMRRPSKRHTGLFSFSSPSISRSQC